MGGNSGTNPSSNFIGTTDNVDVVLKTNSAERLRLKGNGLIQMQGELQLENGLKLGSAMPIKYQAATASQKEILSFGAAPNNGIDYVVCDNPISGLSSKFQFGGTIQILGSNSQGLLNVLELGFDGSNSFVESSVSGNDPLQNRLLLNYYCGKDVLVGSDIKGNLIANNKLGVNVSIIPNDFHLAVNGKIICEEVYVAKKIDWPDYVFDSKYNLLSIKELKNYVKDNKHLPGFLPANQMTSEVPLFQTQIKLVEKVEELTLYIIQLEERIAKLEK
jgi:hypothetical protein